MHRSTPCDFGIAPLASPSILGVLGREMKEGGCQGCGMMWEERMWGLLSEKDS